MTKREPGIRPLEVINPRTMLKDLSNAAIMNRFGMTREDLYNEIRAAYEKEHGLPNCDPSELMVITADHFLTIDPDSDN